jgi:hypothetical protein
LNLSTTAVYYTIIYFACIGTMVNFTEQMQYKTLCRDKLTQQHSSGKSSFIPTIYSAAFLRKVVFYSHNIFRGILQGSSLLFTQNIPRHSSGKLSFIPAKHSAAFFRKVVFFPAKHSAEFFRKVVFYSQQTFRGILKESHLLFTQFIPRHS